MRCAASRSNLFDFAGITADEEKLRDFLVMHNVIASVRFCDCLQYIYTAILLGAGGKLPLYEGIIGCVA